MRVGRTVSRASRNGGRWLGLLGAGIALTACASTASIDVTTVNTGSPHYRALTAVQSPRTHGSLVDVTLAQTEESSFLNELELTYLASLPVVGLYELLRGVVVEDAESSFRARRFDAYFVPEAQGAIDDETQLEVSVDFLAADHFTEGRLRDGWGGDGEELSMQVALNALGAEGQLLTEDRSFLLTEAVKRRSPFLALLPATPGGARAAAQIEKSVGKVLAKYRTEWHAEWDDAVADARRWIADVRAAQEGDPAKLKAGLAAVRRKAEERLAKAFDDPSDEDVLLLARAAVGLLWEPLEDGAVAGLGKNEKALNRLEDAIAKLDRLDDTVFRSLEKAGVDSEGLYDEVKVVTGLAAADHLMTLDFDHVRPSTWVASSEGGAAGARGTAAILVDAKAPESGYRARPGVVFRGKVAELAKIDGARGFSVTSLLLERDSDEIARALRFIQKYADQKDLEVSDVKVAPVVEALAILAEKIAEDDVELKSIDVRFLLPPEGGAADAALKGAPGKPVLALRPGCLVIARNFHGLDDFGALAVVRIRRSESPEPGAAAAQPNSPYPTAADAIR